jgi:glutathione peroxidase-family protein
MINNMKKLILFFTAMCMAMSAFAQSNPVDQMFDKYSDREGFTVVTISSRMFSMFSDLDSDNKDADDLIHRLKSIRILSVEDTLLNRDLNFYTELSKKLNMSDYEELMVVKEGKNMTKFLIKQKGKLITELLVIEGGPGGNSLISIKGDFDLRNISELSKSTGIKELQSLEDVDKKMP